MTPERAATLCAMADLLAREAKARLANATPGPWIREWAQDGEMLPDGTGYAGDYYPTRTVVSIPPHSSVEQEVADCRRGEDAEFIASAHQDVDALSDVVLALVAEVRRLRGERGADTATGNQDSFRTGRVDVDLRPVVSQDLQYTSYVTEEDRRR